MAFERYGVLACREIPDLKVLLPNTEATWLLSGNQETALTWLLCPLSVVEYWPVVRSQIIKLPSSRPEVTWLQSGHLATAVTELLCSKVCRQGLQLSSTFGFRMTYAGSSD
jgi:hypothetical protein